MGGEGSPSQSGKEPGLQAFLLGLGAGIFVCLGSYFAYRSLIDKPPRTTRKALASTKGSPLAAPHSGRKPSERKRQPNQEDSSTPCGPMAASSAASAAKPHGRAVLGEEATDHEEDVAQEERSVAHIPSEHRLRLEGMRHGTRHPHHGPNIDGAQHPQQLLPSATPTLFSSASRIKLVEALQYHKVAIQWKSSEFSQEDISITQKLRILLGLRQKYLFIPFYKSARETSSMPCDGTSAISSRSGAGCGESVVALGSVNSSHDPSRLRLEMVEGVMNVLGQRQTKLINYIDAETFFRDLTKLWRFCKHGPTKSVATKRLEILQSRADMYALLNLRVEAKSIKQEHITQDFYQTAKVDNHIHGAAAMTPRHLLSFIKKKLKECPDEVVHEHNGRPETLKQLFQRLGVGEINIDTLNVCSSKHMFHRFDRFNNAYKPFGHAEIRKVFLKTDNAQGGKFFSELLKQVCVQRSSNTQGRNFMELRLSVYGKDMGEWDRLAKWATRWNMLDTPNNVWIIQIPRLWTLWKKSETSFQDWLDTLFRPLFEVTIQPESHPELHAFLQRVVAIDSVDDESHLDELKMVPFVSPDNLKNPVQPPYSYYSYFMYSNLYVLNKLRERLKLRTLRYRPHAGEAGAVHHLATTFLLAESINHGIKLSLNPTLQYLYYLADIGLSVSPISNNNLFVELRHNPAIDFLKRGLNVCLSTDDPLQFHSTEEPLLEEYTVFKQWWKLSTTDMSEMCRNSVLQSGLSTRLKRQLLGEKFDLPGMDGNSPCHTNLPDCRVLFRYESRLAEYDFIYAASRQDSSFVRSESRPVLRWTELACMPNDAKHSLRIAQSPE